MLVLTDQAFFHGVGRHDKAVPMAPAVVAAAGAYGLIVEVHHNSDRALSDGPQSLRFDRFRLLIRQLRIIALAVRRTI